MNFNDSNLSQMAGSGDEFSGQMGSTNLWVIRVCRRPRRAGGFLYAYMWNASVKTSISVEIQSISIGKTPKFHYRYEVFAQLPGGELGRNVGGYGIDGDPGYIAAEVVAVQESYAFAGGEEARDSLRIAEGAELTFGE
jgi:hypothetical protein